MRMLMKGYFYPDEDYESSAGPKKSVTHDDFFIDVTPSSLEEKGEWKLSISVVYHSTNFTSTKRTLGLLRTSVRAKCRPHKQVLTLTSFP